MASQYVQALGDVEDIDGVKVTVGVDHECVNLNGHVLTQSAMEELAHLLIAATWAAGVNQAEIGEGAGGPAPCPPRHDGPGDPCMAERGGYVCLASPRHDGPHVAYGTEGLVCATWTEDGQLRYTVEVA